MTEEVREEKVNKNWTSEFVHCYSDCLKRLYVQNIDNKRASSEYGLMFKQFINWLSALLCFYAFCTLLG
jgi:hypothetical protein